MLFYYAAKTKEGETKSGTIEAASHDLAIAALQRRELIIVSLALYKSLATFSSKRVCFNFSMIDFESSKSSSKTNLILNQIPFMLIHRDNQLLYLL